MKIYQSHRGVTAYIITLLLLAISMGTSWAAGPTAESTVTFLNGKYQQYGGGYTMGESGNGGFIYSRTFPISITMSNDGLLLIEQAELGFERHERGDAAEINRVLQALDRSAAKIKTYLIPLEQMQFGAINSRRGDWRAQKTLKKSTAKIRVICKEKKNCVVIDESKQAQHFDLFIMDETVRQKMFKAFKHLIGLYQNRKELF
ncbi:MAG: hypothetical protein OEL79_04175 [Chromatiales bacterium]|nr:hypothetical protein [Chromatiales bacterium]